MFCHPTFNFSEELSCLRRALCRDQEHPDQEVNLPGFLEPVELVQLEGLVHEVGQVSYCRYRVAVEANDHDFVDEAAERAG